MGLTFDLWKQRVQRAPLGRNKHEHHVSRAEKEKRRGEGCGGTEDRFHLLRLQLLRGARLGDTIWRAGTLVPKPIPSRAPRALSAALTAIPAPAHRAQCTPPGHHPRQTYLPQHRPENQVPQPPGEDLARFAECEALWGGTRHREKAGQRPSPRRHRGKGTWGQRRGRTPKSEARFQGLAALLLKQRRPRAWRTTSRAGRIWF